MNPWFVSKPNSCKGCPIAKIAPLGARVSNVCHKMQTRYEVCYGLDDWGRQICRVRERIAQSA